MSAANDQKPAPRVETFGTVWSVDAMGGTPDTVILPYDSPLLDGVPVHREDCAVVRGEACSCGAERVMRDPHFDHELLP